MVDRLSPIDLRLNPPQPGKTNSRKTGKMPPLARRVERLGTMALPWMLAYGRSIVPNRSASEATATR